MNDDSLDQLLSDFFKAQVKSPWPGAPATGPMAMPRNEHTAAPRSSGNASRYTLAASVALLLGTCWTLSNGFQPGENAGSQTPTVTNPVDTNTFTAGDSDIGKAIRENNAKHADGNNGGFDPGDIDPFDPEQ